MGAAQSDRTAADDARCGQIAQGRGSGIAFRRTGRLCNGSVSIELVLLVRLAAGCILAAVVMAGTQPATVEWQTRGFQAFRQGTFDSSGADLYVSSKGTLETIHRIDVNQDGYPDLIFNNTHDIDYSVPAYQYVFRGRTIAERREYPGAGSVGVRVADLNGDGRPELVIARGFDDTTHVMNSWIYWGSKDGWNRNRHEELLTPYAQDVCSADFNGDGRTDLAFAGSGTTDVNQTLIYYGGSD